MQLHSSYMAHGLAEYLTGIAGAGRPSGATQFRHLCSQVKRYVDDIITAEHAESDYGTEVQRNALMGKPDAVRYFTGMVNKYLHEHVHEGVEYPSCHTSLVEAVYHEVWGYSVLASWFVDKECQSAKVIGERVYYLINGRQKMQNFTIPKERREQLINALLLNTPQKTRNTPYVEMNLLTGERITLFNRNVTAQGQDVIVLRKYTVQRYTWEEMAKRGTVDPASLPLMKSFCTVGFNVLFTGPVRSGKTTMLETWQAYEDATLEGVSIEATDEIKFHRLMPGSPIMSLLSNEEDISDVIRPVLRSDADYLVLAEARTGAEFDLMIRLANKGTNRCKTTMHSTHVRELVYDIADEVLTVRPNAKYETLLFKVASAYHYVVQLASEYNDKAQKRLMGIYEICPDRQNNTISMWKICAYDTASGTWKWSFHVGEDKRELARTENYPDFLTFLDELKKMEGRSPLAQEDARIAVYGGQRDYA